MTALPLRRLATVLNGGTPGPDQDNWDGDVQWATPVDLAKHDGGVLAETDRRLTMAGLASGSRIAPPGSVLLSTRAPIGYTSRISGEMAFNQGCKAIVPAVERLNPRFIQHWLSASRSSLHELGSGSTFRELGNESLLSFPVPAVEIHEQRRIADFLDDKVTRIDNIIAARHTQMSLGRLALSHKVDSAFAYLAASTVRAGRVLDVLPGYTFPSDGFTDEDDAIRLLRGTNVGVGHVNWSETVRWPVSRTGGLKPFELKVGDVVMGMDRPWIKSGLRIAEIKAEDLPALLLQRVLKFKPGPLVRPRFLYWAYQSADFRNGVESELTGLSVPHLSGDQVKNFELPLPDIAQQDSLVKQFDTAAEMWRIIEGGLERSIEFLTEYKQSLITAAVTGGFDVTTASTEVPA